MARRTKKNRANKVIKILIKVIYEISIIFGSIILALFFVANENITTDKSIVIFFLLVIILILKYIVEENPHFFE